METLKYFTEADLLAIENANSFKELSLPAEVVIKRMGNNVVGLCDHFSTTDKKDNTLIFNTTTEKLIEAGVLLFNEIPFEKKILDLRNKWSLNKVGTSCGPLREDFFRPLLKSGKIKTLLFLPNWELTYDSYWQNYEAMQNKISIVYLPYDWAEHYDISKIPNFSAVASKK